jgi:hypothetical protein
MAIHASNLTSCDLGFQQPETASAPCEFDYVAALCAEVIELQDDDPGVAAVDAARAYEHVPHEHEVASLGMGEGSIAVDIPRIEPPGSCACGGPDSMAVRTDHVAVCELAFQSANGRSSPNQVSHIAALAS